MEGTESVEVGSLLYEDLSTLLRILPLLRPVSFPLLRRSDPPCILLTDASEDGQLLGEVGVFLWCPLQRRAFAAGDKLGARFRDWILGLRPGKKKCITQYELLAALIAYLTFGDILRGRLVHHFIDNAGALSGLIRGSSGKADSSRILNHVHVQVAALTCQPWFGFVYSEDNLSDLPSRGDFALVKSLGAEIRDLQLPDLSGWALPAAL